MLTRLLILVNQRPIMTLMVALGFSLFGFLSRSEVSLIRLERKVYPGIAIRVNAAGFDASKVEEDITTPIEKSIATVGGVRSMHSISEAGSALIQIQMNSSEKLKEKSLEFREKIDLVAVQFPREVHKPQVFRYDPTNSPLMVISFAKENLSQDELRELVEKIFKREWEGVDGISQVIIAGGKIRELLVACDAKQLEAYSLSLRDIVNKFQDVNQNDSLGKIVRIKETLPLQMREKFSDITEIREMPIRVDAQGNIVTLKDIARVSLSPRDDDVGARLNAAEKVTAFLYKNESSDPIQVSKNVRAIIENKNSSKLKIDYNQDESILLTETIRSLFLLMGLVLLSLYLFFHYQKSLLYFAIPFLMTLPFGFLTFLLLLRGIGSNISLAHCYGLLLGTMIWCLSRMRIFTFPGGILKVKKSVYLGYFQVILIGGVAIGLLLSEEVAWFYISLIISGLIASYLLDIYFLIFFVNVCQRKKWLYAIARKFKPHRYQKGVSEFLLGKGITYRNKMIESLLSHKYLYPISFIFLTIIGVYTLLYIDLKDSIESDAREVVAFLEFPSGTSFSHTDEITLRVEKRLVEIPGVKQVVSKIDPSHSLLLIELEEGYLPDRELLLSLKNGIGPTEDGFLFFASEQDSSFFQEVSFDFLGPDQKELEDLTKIIAEKVKSQEGVTESVLRYKPSREELQIRPIPHQFMISNVTLPGFGDELHLALQGGVATKYIDGEKEIDIRVRYAEEFRKSRSQFNEIKIKNTKGKYLPISEIVTTKEVEVPLKFYHKNRIRSLSIAVKLDGNSTSQRKKLIDFVKDYPYPEGYRVELTDEEGGKLIFSNFVSKLLFLVLPATTLLALFLYNERQLSTRDFFSIYMAPYLFTFFLLQFLFPGAFYLPFQVAILIGIPFGWYFTHLRYHLTQTWIYYFACLYAILLLFANATVISFLHIIAGIFVYILLLSAGLRLKGEWKKRFNLTLTDAYKEILLIMIAFLKERGLIWKGRTRT